MFITQDDSTQTHTDGLTRTDSIGGVTGINLCVVNTSASTWYQTGHKYFVNYKGAISSKLVNAAIGEFDLAIQDVNVNSFKDSLALTTQMKTDVDTVVTANTSVVAIKAKTDNLNFTGTGADAKVNAIMTEIDNLDFTALQKAYLDNLDITISTQTGGRYKF